MASRQIAGRSGNPGRQIAIKQKVLAEGPARIQPVPDNDVPQWRQVVQAPRPRMSMFALRCMSRNICRDSNSTRSFTIWR